MKNLQKSVLLLCFSLLFFTTKAQITYPIPEVDRKFQFADVTINLNVRAQQMVNSEIRNLLLPQGALLDQKLERMQLYFPHITATLQAQGVPEDFKYIPVLESSLLPEAISTSNAVGFWQFKSATAREVGININTYVDERKHIISSTNGASVYFKRNFEIYKNWVSSALSFYWGTTGVSKILPSTWANAKEIEFDENTDRYLIKLVAHKAAFEHRLNRIPDSNYSLYLYPTSGKTLTEIAAGLLLDEQQVVRYNQWLNVNQIPSDKLYEVAILSSFQDLARIKSRGDELNKGLLKTAGYPQLARKTPNNVEEGTPIFYEINGKKGILATPGDEVAQLAKKAKVSIKAFLRFNDMSERDMLKEGNVYYLQMKNKKGPIAFHTVLENQTLWDISQIYGIQVKSLKKFNRLTSVLYLQKGRVLYLKSTRPKNKPIEIIEDQEDLITPPAQNLPLMKDMESKEVAKKPTEQVQQKDSATATKVEPVFSDEEEDYIIVDPIIIENTKPTNTPTVNKEPAKIDNKPISTTPSKTANASLPSVKTGMIHVVGQKETLYSISRKYQTSVENIKRWNNLPDNVLQYGQELLVSEPQINTSTENRSSEVRNTSSDLQIHEVAPSETLYSISKKYGMTVPELQRLNGLTDNTISVGQTLRVGRGNGTTQTKNTSIKHIVRAGDTLFSIAKKYGVSVKQVQDLNRLNGNSISVGKELIIKK
ncbi:MAG: LysM peptidoglycan-binding domain-containing protein [Spirosomataceae bacterium]